MRTNMQRVRWFNREPIAYTIGDMYLLVEWALPSPHRFSWARVRKARNRKYWLNAILNNTEAISVEIIHPREV